jgi:ABC-type glutathione transport system ATPase component
VTEPIVTVSELAKRFRGAGGRGAEVVALAGVSLTVRRGEALGIVGESGSGKTTLARCLAGLTVPSGGIIEVCGLTWAGKLSHGRRRQLARRLQLVFQDPYTSLNPRMRTASLIGEGLRVHRLCQSREEERSRVEALMADVGLGAELARQYPRELSGGQRQRAALARALALGPEVLVLDEPVSSLDVSVQAQILNLLRDLAAEREMSTVIVSHDLAVIRFTCDRVIVMCEGAVVEEGAVEDVLSAPQHPYTRELIASVPGAGPVPPSERNPSDVADELPTGRRGLRSGPAVSRRGGDG